MKEVRVVLADDHALMRAGLRDALNRLPGLETVGEAGNGSDLLRELDRSRPDLLVVDVNMPEFEPVSAIRYICANYPAMKILVVSAYDDQAHVVGLLAAGVNGYHLKDQPLSDFHLAVQRVLDGGRWISDPLVNRLVDQHLTPTETTPLTRRQRELLYFLTQGYNNQKIARVLNLSIKTVENHLTALYKALNVEGRLEASNYGSRHPELISIPGQGKIDAQRHRTPVHLTSGRPVQVQLLLAPHELPIRVAGAESTSVSLGGSRRTGSGRCCPADKGTACRGRVAWPQDTSESAESATGGTTSAAAAEPADSSAVLVAAWSEALALP